MWKNIAEAFPDKSDDFGHHNGLIIETINGNLVHVYLPTEESFKKSGLLHPGKSFHVVGSGARYSVDKVARWMYINDLKNLK